MEIFLTVQNISVCYAYFESFYQILRLTLHWVWLTFWSMCVCLCRFSQLSRNTTIFWHVQQSFESLSKIVSAFQNISGRFRNKELIGDIKKLWKIQRISRNSRKARASFDKWRERNFQILHDVFKNFECGEFLIRLRDFQQIRQTFKKNEEMPEHFAKHHCNEL